MHLNLLFNSTSLSSIARARPADHACCCIESHTRACPRTRPIIKESCKISSSLPWRKGGSSSRQRHLANTLVRLLRLLLVCHDEQLRLHLCFSTDDTTGRHRPSGKRNKIRLIFTVRAAERRSRGPTASAAAAAGTKAGAIAFKDEQNEATGCSCCSWGC